MLIVTAIVLATALASGPQAAASTRPTSQKPKPAATVEPQRPRAQTADPRRPSAALQAVTELRTEVRTLETRLEAMQQEIVRQRAVSVSQGDLARLTLLEDREGRLETRLAASRGRLRDAQDREADTRRRMDNITSERIAYGGINREDSERAVKNYLDRELDRARNDQVDAQAEVTRVEGELDQTRRAADSLRRKLRLTPEDVDQETGAAEDDTPVNDPGGAEKTVPNDADTDTTLDPVPASPTRPPAF